MGALPLNFHDLRRSEASFLDPRMKYTTDAARLYIIDVIKQNCCNDSPDLQRQSFIWLFHQYFGICFVMSVLALLKISSFLSPKYQLFLKIGSRAKVVEKN